MTVADIIKEFELKTHTGDVGLEHEITDVYICDLLSWVMGRADEGIAWITIRGHINVVAVAQLAGVSCIIIAENGNIDDNTIEKAIEEEIPILSTHLSAYHLAKLFVKAGI